MVGDDQKLGGWRIGLESEGIRNPNDGQVRSSEGYAEDDSQPDPKCPTCDTQDAAADGAYRPRDHPHVGVEVISVVGMVVECSYAEGSLCRCKHDCTDDNSDCHICPPRGEILT